MPIRFLGRGGQAEVWLAEDLELRELVAIKILHDDLSPAARERLRREVSLGRALPHPLLVRVFELIEVGSRLAVVMEWVEGGSLATRLESGPLPIAEIVSAARDTLEALAYLHSHDVVHRDIKPSNLLVSAEGRVKLADLGLARSLAEASDVTLTHAAVGTPAYMSPEQRLCANPQPSSDIYALGVTLYEMLTGRRPVPSALQRTGSTVAKARIPSLRRLRPDCPRWFASFTMRLLEANVRDRFDNASEAFLAFEKRGVLMSPSLRRRLVVGAAAGIVAMAAGLTFRDRAGCAMATIARTGSEIKAIDLRGRVMWRKEFPGAHPEPQIVDVVADETPEVVVGLQALGTGLSEDSPNLFVLSSRGHQLAALAGSMGEFGQRYPAVTPRIGGTTIEPADLDGDGKPDLVWRTLQRPWYPTVLGGWCMRAGKRPSALFVSSGNLSSVAATALLGDGRPRLVVTGVNNPLGYQSFVAVVDPIAAGISRIAYSPDLVSVLATGGVPEGFRFALLGPHQNKDVRIEVSRGGIVLSLPTGAIQLDRDGMPETSKGTGAGWPAHRRFWEELAVTCVGLEAGQIASGSAFRELASRHGEILAEAPTRLAAVLLVARSMARAGRHEDAVALLSGYTREAGGERDTWLRLGEQLAILGRLREALVAFEHATATASGGRRPLDSLTARTLLACTIGDAKVLSDALQVWEGWYPDGNDGVVQDFRAIWAFTCGDWDAGELLAAPSGLLVPAARPIRLWAAWRRGTAVEATRHAAQALLEDPETADLARLLLAQISISEGKAGEGIALARQTLARLERQGRESWMSFAWVPLAERVLADGLVAAGKPGEAAAHFSRSRQLAPGAWFGRSATQPFRN